MSFLIQKAFPLVIGLLVLNGLSTELTHEAKAQNELLAPPTRTKISATRSGLVLSWAQVEGASSYEVFRSQSSTVFPSKPFALPQGTSLAVTRLSQEPNCYFIIRAVRGKHRSNASTPMRFSLLATNKSVVPIVGSPTPRSSPEVGASVGAIQATAIPSQPVTGYYRLRTRGENGFAVDVFGAGNFNGAKVVGWSAGKTGNQRWKVESQDGGTYKIRAFSGQNSDQVLEIFGGNPLPGKAATLYTDNNSDAQRWYFQDMGEGYYRIIPKVPAPAADLTLQVRGGKMGEALELDPFDGSDAQLFRLEDFGAVQPRSASYRVTLRNHPELSLGSTKKSNSVAIELQATSDSPGQRWRIDLKDDGSYKIRAEGNQVLDLADGAPINGNLVRGWSDNGAPAQSWYLKEVSGGYFRIVPQSALPDSDQTLQVSGGVDVQPGAGLEIFPFNGTDNQVFWFDDLEAAKK